jgi:hypothetical protein
MDKMNSFISNSRLFKRNEEFYRLLVSLKYFIPFVIFLLYVTYFFIKIGEIYRIEDVIQVQADNEMVLFGPALSDYTIEYKFSSAMSRDYEILIVGTSRVMQFRSNHFAMEMYNAGGIISNVGQIGFVVERLTAHKKPDYIIIGLDQNFFNERSRVLNENEENILNERLQNANNLRIPNLTALIRNLSGYFQLLYHNELVYINNIGINSNVYNTGFRNDGSYDYGDFSSISNRNKGLTDTLNRIQYEGLNFEYGNEVYFPAINEVKDFLEFASEQGIKVIGFMPPYSPSVCNYMKNYDYSYMSYSSNELVKIFDNYDFRYIDYSCSLNTDDLMFIDGFHGDENVYNMIAHELSNYLYS